MSARTLSLLFGLAIPAALAGCGDDDNPGTPDAPPRDSAVDARPTFKGFDADEGGEVRVEYVRFASGMASTRATAFLYDNAGPTKYFPYPNLNGCTDTSTDMNWPVATNEIGQRKYHNMGNVLVSGGPQTLTIPPRAQGTDPFGRSHPGNQWNFFFNGPTANDAGLYLTEKTAYDVAFTGSDNLPAQIFDNVLYMPADFQLVPAPGTPIPATPIPAGQPLTLSWQKVEANAPQGYEVQSLVAFTSPATGPVVLCIEPDDGSITVPAQFIDIARAKLPTGGTLARQTLTHVVRELEDKNGPTGKRIDFISVWCYATTFTVP